MTTMTTDGSAVTDANALATIRAARLELQAMYETEKIDRAPVALVDGKLVPTTIDGLWRLAKLTHSAGILPEGIETPDQALIVLAAGFEAGLSWGQTLKGVMLVNNKPSLWGDVALAVCRRSPICESIVEELKGWPEGGPPNDATVAICTCRRKGEPVPIVRTFSVADAKKAGLWHAYDSQSKSPWARFPKRMLPMRARAYALRDAFPDLLVGLSIVEEEMDRIEVEAESAAGSFRGRVDALKPAPAATPAPAPAAAPAPEPPADPKPDAPARRKKAEPKAETPPSDQQAPWEGGEPGPAATKPQDGPAEGVAPTPDPEPPAANGGNVPPLPARWASNPKESPAHPGYWRNQIQLLAAKALPADKVAAAVEAYEDEARLPGPDVATKQEAAKAYREAASRAREATFDWKRFV